MIRIKNILLLTVVLVIGGCILNKQESIVFGELEFRNLYSIEHAKDIQKEGYSIKGEFIIDISYRKKVHNVKDLKQAEKLKIKEIVDTDIKGNIVYVYSKDTCMNISDKNIDFYDNYNENKILCVVFEFIK